MNATLAGDISNFAERFPLWESLKGKHIAVTGATGLLGSCMVRCLLALNDRRSLGLRVTSVVRNKSKAIAMFGDESPHYNNIYVYDFADDRMPFDVRDVDFLAHFAAPTASKYFVTNPVETIATVINGSNTILEYAESNHLDSLVFASTLEVYGTILDDSEPLVEADQGYIDPIDTRASYPMAKRLVECLCHAYARERGVPVKIARLAQTFGAGISPDDNRVFAQFARAAINKQDIVLNTTGELSRGYCYTTDAISAMLHILLKGEDGEAYNVVNERTYISVIDMARLVCREFNPNGRVVVRLKGDMGYLPTTKLRLSAAKTGRLGWQPEHDLTDMFSRLISSLD